MTEYPGLLKLIIVFHDNNPAHLSQALGVAISLSELTGAEVAQFDIPQLKGLRRFFANSRKSQLLTGRKEEALSWLKCAKGERLLRSVAAFFSKNGIRENSGRVLLISAGSNAAAYNLAIATTWKVACAVVGYPSVIGSSRFEFAIITEYEDAPEEPNILKTVLPPNNIQSDTLKEAALNLKKKCHPKSEKIWALLLGGNDKHYRLTPKNLKRTLLQLIVKAELADADIYITTSKRTTSSCVNMLKKLAEEHDDVIRYLHIASEDSDNPVAAFLGLADTIFCTEDSINMVSEAVTGGKRVVLLRTDRVKGIKRLLLKLDETLIKRGAIPRSFGFGTVKFDLIYDRLKRHNKVVELKEWLKRGDKADAISWNLPENIGVWDDFNEAHRAAKWIAKSLVR